MKTWGTILLSVAILVVGLTGCGPAAKEPASSQPLSSGGENPSFVFPAIHRDRVDRPTADGILSLMQESNRLFLESGEASLAQRRQREAALAAAKAPALKQPVPMAPGAIAADLKKAAASYTDGAALYFKSGSYTLTESVTLPENFLLVFESGAAFTLADGVTLRIGGLLEAPLSTLFMGDGAVRCDNPLQTGYPQWFGAKGDGKADDSAAIQASLDAFFVTALPLTAGGYRCAGVRIGEGKTLTGEGGDRPLVTAAAGSDAVFSIEGGGVTLGGLKLALKEMAAGSTAIRLNNAEPLDDIVLRDLYISDGYHVLTDNGGGQPVTNLRLFEVDCRDQRDTSFRLRDVAAFLSMRHCIVDYNAYTALAGGAPDYPAIDISGCVGLLMEQCDVLGSYTGGADAHGFVLRDCAAVYLDREYADTLNGRGFWLQGVSFATLSNCGSGLNADVGLLMEDCREITVRLYKQFGRYELDAGTGVDGIVVKNCEGVAFDNLQSLCNRGNALTLENSTGVTVDNYTTYLNRGQGFFEAGASDHNLVTGYTVTSSSRPYTLAGAQSGIISLTRNDGGYEPAATGETIEAVGQYAPAPVVDAVFDRVPAEVVAEAFDRACALYTEGQEALRTAQASSAAASSEDFSIYATYSTGNIRSYGAKGDGETDDAPAFQRAFSEPHTVFLPAGTYRIGQSFTLPLGAMLVFEKGARLHIDEGVTVTVNGLIEAGAYEIFSCRGRLIGRPQNAFGLPQWFGAAGDGETDDTAAFRAALSLFSEVRIPYTSDGYLLKELLIPGDRTLRGTGAKAPVLVADKSASSLLRLRSSNVVVEDIDLDLSAAPKNSVALYLDNSLGGIERFRFRNIRAVLPHTFVADANTGNKTVVGNIHFDGVTVLSPRGSAFLCTDFFGFLFFRNVTVDYEGAVTNAAAFSITTNFGAILEDCTVRGAGTGSIGDGFVFKDSWAIWLNRCRAENIGGRGFVARGISHCYFQNLTARRCGEEGFLLQGRYFQALNLTGEDAVSRVRDSIYLTVSHISGDAAALTVENSGCCGFADLSGEAGVTETGSSDFNRYNAVEKATLSGLHSAMTKRE